MKVMINDNIFKIKLCVSEKEKETGMMKKKFNESYNGMLFIQNSGRHCFWMKNCIINLDIIFIKDNVITKIHHDCPPLLDDEEHVNYCGNGDMVLEIDGGSCKKLDIKEGDMLSFLF